MVIGVDDQPSLYDGAHAISGTPIGRFLSLTLETVRYLDKGQKAGILNIQSSVLRAEQHLVKSVSICFYKANLF